jgi:hypothetical protein
MKALFSVTLFIFLGCSASRIGTKNSKSGTAVSSQSAAAKNIPPGSIAEGDSSTNSADTKFVEGI